MSGENKVNKAGNYHPGHPFESFLLNLKISPLFIAMNIFAHPGHKVIVTEKSFSYSMENDQKQVEKHLEIGKTYTVQRTEVFSFHTNVWLEEVPGQKFNSVCFDDVVKYKSKFSRSNLKKK